jgi:hypothetical protein
MDSLIESFSEIKNKAFKIISPIKTNDFSRELDEIIASTKKMLENQTVIDDLNECIFWLYMKNDDQYECEYECFYELIEGLMKYLEAKQEMPINDQNENAFKIIEIISSMRVREILVIKSTFVLRLLNLITPDRERRILNIILSLSENYVYEKLDFFHLDHSTLLDRIDQMVIENLPIKNKIISNLNEKLFRERLEYLIQFDLSEKYGVEQNRTFLNDLKALSLVLNQKKERFMHAKLIS